MNPRAYIAVNVLAMAENQIMYREMEVGQMLAIKGIDRSDNTEKETFLQLVYYQKRDPSSEVVIFAILDNDFHFTDGESHDPATVPIGTFAMAGLSMHWLPSPVYKMVGFGGVGLGRDYSLEYVNGEGRTLIIPRITEIVQSTAPKDFVVPPRIDEYLASVAAIKTAEEEARSPENLARYRAEYMDWLEKDLGEGFALLEPILGEFEQFPLAGLYSVGDFLSKAHDQGKLFTAIEQVRKGCQEQWGYQHPQMRADPQMGSNGSYIAQCYADAGITMVSNAIDSQVPEDADQHYLRLREALEAGPQADDQSVESLVITAQKPGQLAIIETRSGNRYLIEVIDPDNRLINMMCLKKRTGFPGDGYFENARSADPTVGQQLETSEVNTSQLQAIHILA